MELIPLNEIRVDGVLLTDILNQHHINREKKRGMFTSLSRADLSFADLRNINLGYADLNQAILVGADLSNSNFEGANLSYADLKGSICIKTNFKKANLSRADFRGSHWENVNFTGARRWQEIWHT